MTSRLHRKKYADQADLKSGHSLLRFLYLLRLSVYHEHKELLNWYWVTAFLLL